MPFYSGDSARGACKENLNRPPPAFRETTAVLSKIISLHENTQTLIVILMTFRKVLVIRIKILINLLQAFRETPAVSLKVQLAWKYAGRPFAYHGLVT